MGHRAINFVVWFVYKAQLFAAPLFLFNIYTGYSGYHYIDTMYYALFEFT